MGALPRRAVTTSDAVNPNDGSRISDIKSNSSGRTAMTSVEVPRRVREKVIGVAPQLYEQNKLAEICREDFEALTDARKVARECGVIDSIEDARLPKVNRTGNKHNGNMSGSVWEASLEIGVGARWKQVWK